MNIFTFITTALESILADKFRSFLTMLGIIIGVASVTILVSIGRGSQQQIQDRIQSLGTNMLMIMPGSSTRGGFSYGAGSLNRFSFKDIEDIQNDAPHVAAISPVISINKQVISNMGNWSTRIEGVTPDYQQIRNWEVAEGEFFTEAQNRARAKVAVLGTTVADELFPGEDPVGQKIRIGTVPVTVIGLLQSRGQSGMGNDMDDIILIPANTAYYRLSGDPHLGRMFASTSSQQDADLATREISTILRRNHRLSGDDPDDFTIRSQTDIIEMAEQTSQSMTLLLGSVAGVSLLVGGIGIMNIMLVSVTERTREIGIRRAIGATYRAVLTQFLLEAVVLSLVGGLIGVVLAIVSTEALNAWTSYKTVFSPTMSISAFLFAGFIGVFFGFYPAHKAASLHPIEALRYE